MFVWNSSLDRDHSYLFAVLTLFGGYNDYTMVIVRIWKHVCPQVSVRV